MNRIARLLKKSEEGFTLIELLVVVAIIALLAAFAVPKLFDAINKSKKAPGQADMQTISGALDRYYMEQDIPTYPTSNVQSALTAKYVKSTTSFVNGFKQGYIYGVSAAGDAYVLIDLAGGSVTGMTTTSVTLTCNSNSYTFTAPAGGGLYANYNMAAADMSSCTLPTGATFARN